MMYNKFQVKLMPWVAKFATSFLCAVLFVCANTNSSCVFYQPETPGELEKFKKVR